MDERVNRPEAGDGVGGSEAPDPAHGFVPRTFYQRRGKRIIDLACAGVALLVLGPLFLVIALAVKLDTRGPVFYVSTRLGRRARPFAFVKFRSMVRDAERLRGQLDALNEMDGPVF